MGRGGVPAVGRIAVERRSAAVTLLVAAVLFC